MFTALLKCDGCFLLSRNPFSSRPKDLSLLEPSLSTLAIALTITSMTEAVFKGQSFSPRVILAEYVPQENGHYSLPEARTALVGVKQLTGHHSGQRARKT